MESRLSALLASLDLDELQPVLEAEDLKQVDVLQSMGSELHTNLASIGIGHEAINKLAGALFPTEAVADSPSTEPVPSGDWPAAAPTSAPVSEDEAPEETAAESLASEGAKAEGGKPEGGKAEGGKADAAADAVVEIEPPGDGSELVGKVVEIAGLKARPELNGRRGRAISFNPESGRVGVVVKKITALGGSEKVSLSLKPSCLTAVAVEAAPVKAEEPEGVNWTTLLGSIGLKQYYALQWARYEERLFDNQKDSAKVCELLEKIGIPEAEERQKIAEALVVPCAAFGGTTDLAAIARLIGARLSKDWKKDEEAFEKAKEEREKNVTAPHADANMRLSGGRVCPQKKGDIDESDAVRPPLDAATISKKGQLIYPTSEEAGQLADILRKRSRLTVSFGSGERILEGMLQRRGVDCWACDTDIFQDDCDYYDQRIYCKEVRRVGVGNLLIIPNPAQTSLLFSYGILLPYRAYLARYPDIRLVGIIGDPHDSRKCHEPKVDALKDEPGWRVLLRRELSTWQGARATLVLYER